MKRLLAFAYLAWPLQAAPEPLFNGKSLDGWRVQDADYWSASDGLLRGASDAAKENSILWTKKEFADFTLEFDFRFSGDIDSGVFLRGENDQIQIGVSRSLKRDVTGSPYIASLGRYPVEAEGAELVDGGWNHMKIIAEGPRYIVEINGKRVLDYRSETAEQKGPIGLQIHSGVEMAIEFRKLRMEPRDPAE